ncbi:hypothetical protein BD410DRAFT_728878 [Rickenella mellea]|uniref:Bromo domain-containing protein n=1 Tax=Rickenella mellea TaxID=50990 RepID=A0A4Y7PUG1_9AGAM|nr:hypothetical protein BD410DRAFT_728878 [Rickenella mellea]
MSKAVGKAFKGKGALYGDTTLPKAPRQVKLKPLKEVLTKLMVQIKKKDDYAFFLQPVDASQVPGYADAVKFPMDFGTMTNKVDKGRYRSLEDFTADFRLVTSNARLFNPPSTLFHTEATRIEEWGLDQITKASAQVIEYETDWNIDVVADDNPTSTLGDDIDEGGAKDTLTRIKQDNEEGRSIRSGSVTSTGPGQTERSKRVVKTSQKKPPGTISESIEVDGRLPGSKDGLGAFTPGSDMANLMLALKLKGKRYRTKKERLRVEKEGLPLLPDGSLDYSEMEDPFSIFQNLVPDARTMPGLIPVLQTPGRQDSLAVSREETPLAEGSNTIPIPSPTSVPLESIPSLFPADRKAHLPVQSATGKKRLRHWTIVRNSSSRSRVRDGDDEFVETVGKKRRVAEITDYGTFSALPGLLAAEQKVSAETFGRMLGTEDKLFEAIRRSLHSAPLPLKNTMNETGKDDENKVQNLQELLDAEEYITDVVYGGDDGLAYVRSLAEFVRSSRSSQHVKSECSDDLPSGGLKMPLSEWVETNIVNPLTSGRHSLLRDTLQRLVNGSTSSMSHPEISSASANQELHEYLQTLKQLSGADEKIDMVPLLRAPHELFIAENEWSGVEFKATKEREREEMESALAKSNAAEFLAYAIENHRRAELPIAGAPSGSIVNATSQTAGDTTEVIDHALDVGADAIVEIDRRVREDGKGLDGTVEDPALRKLRLNLLAVAKRAPLDKIGSLPPDLVPPHILRIVPSLSS